MIFVLTVVVVFLADLMIKKYMEQKLPDHWTASEQEQSDKKIIFRKLHNKGIAFGAFENSPKLVERGTLGILAVVAAWLIYLLTKPGLYFKKFGTSMMLGGGLCNWFDRFHQGYVTDYFSFNVKWKRVKSLVFNLSDMFIFLGMFLSLFGKSKGRRRS